MLERCHTIDDLRAYARRRLPRPVFDVLDGGAESESTLRSNVASFDRFSLIPRHLSDVGDVNTCTSVLGQVIQWPVICSPTGGSGFFHSAGEIAVARAAASAGTLYGLSTGSTYSLEEVAAASPGPKFFQLYICKDRELTWSLIERAKRSGYSALCVTVDTPVIGNCLRELRSGILGPRGRWPAQTVMAFARKPCWVLHRLRNRSRALANFEMYATEGRQNIDLAEQLDPSITWSDVRAVGDRWKGTLAVKGVLSADDACRAADAGASAVIVSNHGGRQLDGAITAIDALPAVAQAVRHRVEVILDGGVRRGVHVLKALASGAKACSVGRAYLYGLAAGGEAGVAKALTILRGEFLRALRLGGYPDVGAVEENLLQRGPQR